MIDFERYEKIFGRDFDISQVQSSEFLWSVRTNTLKISVENLLRKFKERNYEVENIPFCKGGFWLRTTENLSKTLEHNLGYFFIQNASSMIPPLILGPREDEIVLDLCAAPGAKTTEISAIMKNNGVVIANDISNQRLKALRGNLQRCGIFNTIVTNTHCENFWKLGLNFEKILLDVPCTATGTLNPRVLKETSVSSVRMLSNTQKRLLSSAYRCLSEKGTIIYSTCSIEPEENEENIDFAIRELGLETEGINVENLSFISGLTRWDGHRYDDSVSNAIRIKPNNKMEGFFICKLKK